jgi:hypothetical protein
MFYGQTPTETRQFFFLSWSKYNQKQPLTPLEQQLAAVILDHPEYHSLLNNPDANLEKNYFPELGETNPFLHMGLHLAIREQVSTDRPPGIHVIFNELTKKTQDPLTAEHDMMTCLAESLWQAQRHQSMPDEAAYLNACRQLVSDSLD